MVKHVLNAGAIPVADAEVLQSAVWPITVFSVRCFGNESVLLECVFDDHPQQCDGLQAALICHGMFIYLYYHRIYL